MALAQPTPQPANAADDVWTFGFGSNMNIELLRSKKGMNVLDFAPAVVTGWRLSFQKPAFALVEPSFADARPSAERGDEIHGVVVRLPPADYARLAAQESAYDDAAVTAVTYDGRAIAARLFTMRSPPAADAADIPCSLRYLRVLVSGAREAGLREDYVARLAARPTYAATPETLARRAAALAVPPASLPPISVAELAAAWAPAPRGGAAADAETARVAVAGFVFELPRARTPFAAHRGRDITARAGRQWRGEPLDADDDWGRPPFVVLAARPEEEREFILNYFDAYVERSGGKVVGFLTEYREALEAAAT
jgi:hypothetical protein